MHHMCAHTHWHAQVLYPGHSGMYLFFESTVFHSKDLLLLALLSCSFLGKMPRHSALLSHLRVERALFFLLLKRMEAEGGQFWVAVLSDTEGLKKTELEILKNLEHMEMSHSHREDHTLGNFLPCLTINIQK